MCVCVCVCVYARVCVRAWRGGGGGIHESSIPGRRTTLEHSRFRLALSRARRMAVKSAPAGKQCR